MKNIPTSIAKSGIMPLRLTASVSAALAEIHKTVLELGTSVSGLIPLMISNK